MEIMFFHREESLYDKRNSIEEEYVVITFECDVDDGRVS